MAWALNALGGHLDRLARADRPKGLLTMQADRLISLVGGKNGARLRQDLAAFDHSAAIDEARDSGIALACRHGGDFTWPTRLLQDPEPPAVLHVLGDPSLLDVGGVAIVGARKADSYGRGVAGRLGGGAAAAGVVVISGLALGIDGAAHRGALEVEGGRSLAVVGGGVNRVYPRTHASLHSELAERGAVISEMPPSSGVWRWSFPARNRLIAALSDLVVVVEAALGSGSLHTAEAAIARNIGVAAVPGDIDNPLNGGSNRLIADGAAVICRSSDMLSALGIVGAPVRSRLPSDLIDVLTRITGGLSAIPDDADAATVAEHQIKLAKLELCGVIKRGRDGRWIATSVSEEL